MQKKLLPKFLTRPSLEKKGSKYVRGTEQLLVPPRMGDEQVNATTLNGAMSGAQMGGQLGSLIPGVGNVAGMIGGGLIGGAASYFGASNQQKQAEQANQEALRKNANIQKYSTDISGQEKKQINPNYIAYGDNMNYAQVAKKGKKSLGKKAIEIEGGEPVFRPKKKDGKKVYSLVKYEKNGRKHEEGGIPIIAKEGDAIVTAKKGQGDKAVQAYKKGDQKTLKKIIAKMPPDKPVRKKQDGDDYVIINGKKVPRNKSTKNITLNPTKQASKEYDEIVSGKKLPSKGNDPLGTLSGTITGYDPNSGIAANLQEFTTPGTALVKPKYTRQATTPKEIKEYNDYVASMGGIDKANAEVLKRDTQPGNQFGGVAEQPAKSEFRGTSEIVPMQPLPFDANSFTPKPLTTLPVTPNVSNPVNNGSSSVANRPAASQEAINLKRGFDPTKFANVGYNMLKSLGQPEVDEPIFQKSRNIIYNDRSNPARQANMEAQNLATAQSRNSVGGNAAAMGNAQAMSAQNAAKQRNVIDTGEVGRYDQTYNTNAGIDNADIANNTQEKRNVRDINDANRAMFQQFGANAAKETAMRGDINEQAINTKYDREFGYKQNADTNAQKKQADQDALRFYMNPNLKPEAWLNISPDIEESLIRQGYSKEQIAANKAQAQQSIAGGIKKTLRHGARSLTIKTKTASEKYKTSADYIDDMASMSSKSSSKGVGRPSISSHSSFKLPSQAKSRLQKVVKLGK